MSTPPTFPATVDFLATVLPMWEASERWWHLAAAKNFRLGRYDLISENGSAYLLRVWLHGYRRRDNHTPETERSVMLHWIIRADVDRELHSHPWEWYTTTVLSGGYCEQLPAGSVNGEWAHIHGPGVLTQRALGVHDEASHVAGELHRIAEVKPETWTLVTTGPRSEGGWWFHPPGDQRRNASGCDGGWGRMFRDPENEAKASTFLLSPR